MSALADHLERYLAVRRGLGYQLSEHGRVLGTFVTYAEATDQHHVTVSAALAWACRATSDDQVSRRLSMLRRFAVYLSAFDPATEIPPTNLGPPARGRSRPYLYSAEEVAALMGAARALRPELWGASLATLIGLMAATGIRSGEAYRLDRANLDVDAGQLAVMHTKFGKSRLLPLHPTTAAALARYLHVRDGAGEACEPALFVTEAGRRISASRATYTFRRLLVTASIAAPAGRRRPRLYDLRHTFAVDTLLGWHRDGVDVQRQLPVLSAYLGHQKPADTYWYLEATPELMAVVADRLANSWESRP